MLKNVNNHKRMYKNFLKKVNYIMANYTSKAKIDAFAFSLIFSLFKNYISLISLQ